MPGIDRRSLALAGVVAALTLISFLLRVPCLAPDASGLALAVPGCHGDLEEMWLNRGLAAGNLPYLQPFVHPQTGQLVTVEYPVLTGLLMWLLSRVGTFAGFLALSTLVMGVAAVGVTLILYRWTRRRAWLWAAAPALVHYLAYNYDALPALAVVVALGLVLGRDPTTVRGLRYLGAAAILGIGGGLKLYPLVFLLPLALWLLFGRPGAGQLPLRARLGRALAAGTVGTAVFVAVNLPILLANPQGWWLPFSFQASRPIDASTLSIWFFASSFWPSVGQAQWMLAAGVATAAGIAVAAAAGWLIGRRQGGYPLLGTCISVLAAYLLFNKVFSPQYILWLLPLLVLVGLRARLVVVYLVIDVVMFWALGVEGWTLQYDLRDTTNALVALVLSAAVVRMAYVFRVAIVSASLPDPVVDATSAGQPV
jgi:hypothetical protein